MKGLLDTNILIDYLSGIPDAASTVASYTEKLISRITWMEVLAGITDSSEDQQARQFMGSFRIVELSEEIANQAVTIRRSWPKKLKLPDAVIYASAKTENCSLVTRNTNDFDPARLQDVVVPYNFPTAP